jgi:DNA (cytosine-5)-methyltransferase 1
MNEHDFILGEGTSVTQLKFNVDDTNNDVISFFSGAMGLDIGLQMAGLNIKIGQEYDTHCVETIKSNGYHVISGDIRKVKPEQLLEAAGLLRAEPFLVCGGPPCQSFSTAGKRHGLQDSHGSLFMDFIRMIDYIRPRYFLMENVKGILSSRTNRAKLKQSSQISLYDDAMNLSALDIILSEFQVLGYRTVYGLLDAVNYGAPQFRERFILLGSREDEDIFLPMPTHFQTHQCSYYRWMTLKDAIYDLEEEPGECTRFSTERLQYLQMVPAGGNWKNLSDDCVERAMGGAYRSGGGKVGFYRRLSYNEPSPTLVTSPVQKASMLCHPVQDRPLSVREYARIQQFPDDWMFVGNTLSKYRQIGNAVPIGLAKAIGDALLTTARGKATVHTKRTRGTNVHNRIRNAIEMGEFYGNQPTVR